ncbi:MAG: glycosyltransferase family 2 protein [Chloroflexaceae bacterium]|nr:glycosyltransferase family 2 protein [Chloroflexaceae bacterium]
MNRVPIDIIIPTYNGLALLAPCLDALRAQTHQDFRVTVVDDGSTDDTLSMLARCYPEVNIVALPQNRGLATAVNAALRATAAPIVVLLNNDTEAHPHWLERLVGALERYPAYDFAASKLLLYDRRDRIHSTGDYYRPNGVPDSRGVWQYDHGQYDALSEVFGPCAAAAAYRRSVLDALAVDGNILDEDLVMYCEDVDLNIRARLHGYRTLYVPDAIVYHRLSATGGGTLASYYCGRNFALVWLKNMPRADLRQSWLQFATAQLGFVVHSLWHIREPAARARLRGQFAALRAVPRFWRKRRQLPPPRATASPTDARQHWLKRWVPAAPPKE